MSKKPIDKKSRKKNIAIGILVFLVIILSSSTVYYYSATSELDKALSDLLTSIIEKSDCKQLAEFQSSPSTMALYGNLINQTEKEESCP